jgi:hypothetical protein
MTHTEINEAIAEHLGYGLIGNEWHKGGMLAFAGTGARWTPTYAYDLNAMHEAEKVLDDAQERAYELKLARVVRHERGISDYDSIRHTKFTTYATAAQRAEAFLKTLNLWK